MQENQIVVECYSSFEYAERPRAFEWREKRYQIAMILVNWRTPEGKCFLVQTSSREEFILCYKENSDLWEFQTR